MKTTEPFLEDEGEMQWVLRTDEICYDYEWYDLDYLLVKKLLGFVIEKFSWLYRYSCFIWWEEGISVMSFVVYACNGTLQ